MPEYVWILLAILLVCLIVVAVRVFFVVGAVQATLTKVEETRAEVTDVVKKLDDVAVTVNKLLEEEVTPTLRVARENLEHIEVTTRALADTTTAARRVAQRADTLINSQQLFALGGTVGKLVAQRAPGLITGALRVAGRGVMSLFHRRKPEPPPAKPTRAPAKPTGPAKALPSAESKANLSAPDTVPVKALVKVNEKEKARKGR